MNLKTIFKKSSLAFFMRILGAFLAFVVTFVFAGWLGPADFGLFTLALTVVTVISVVTRWGLDQVVLKNVSISHRSKPKLAKSYLVNSTLFVFLLSLFLSLLLWLSSGYIAYSVFEKPDFESVLAIFSLLIIPMSLRFLIGESFKGYGKPVLAMALQSVVAPLFVVFSFIVLFFLDDLTFQKLMVFYVLGGYLSLFLIFYFWRKIVPKIPYRKISFVSLNRIGRPFLIATSGAMVMLWSDVIVLGVYASEHDLGVYSAASRVIMLLSLLSVAVVSIMAPVFAERYSVRDWPGFQKAAQNSATLLFMLGAFPTAIFVLFPDLILSVLGAEYSTGSSILVVLALGQFLSLSFGPVGYLLTMTGHEKEFQKIMLITAVVNIFLSIFFFKIIGVIGVAYATALSIGIWNAWAVFSIKRKLGVSVINISFIKKGFK